MRLSGIQKEVLSLYRRCLREAVKKPIVSVAYPILSSPVQLLSSHVMTLFRMYGIILRHIRGI